MTTTKVRYRTISPFHAVSTSPGSKARSSVASCGFMRPASEKISDPHIVILGGVGFNGSFGFILRPKGFQYVVCVFCVIF